MTNIVGLWGAIKTAMSPADRERIKGAVEHWNDDTKIEIKVDDGLDKTPDWTWLFGLGVAIAIGVGLFLAYRRFFPRRQE